MRVIIKGGVWKNTEDEILKVAISKYGLNQWARISSLLVRKTPKQCKARWYEWLDPSIKKTEWSREEDEKLLHLAKLMPTQWRTIAPIVGRTANQCLDRYQRLLDEAEAQEDQASGSSLALTGTGEAAPSAEDVRKLRPGEIDPNPETKPARPDPIDMDEDEKEMLSEARARLANTQGKKAKRKARERALEESRRLSMLQKRRELKAAGIMTKPKPKKGEMDFNADIPFEKRPALGFYDTSNEANKEYKTPIGKTLAALNSRVESQDMQKSKRQHETEQKSKQATTGKNEEQIRKLKEAEQISKRRKLNLPAAQVGEDELEQIVKLGQAGERARLLVDDDSNQATGNLLGEYSSLDTATARTPQRGPDDDTVMREARNLRHMTNAQTPLLGDANVKVHAANRVESAQTPNPLLTPRTADGSYGEGTPMRTPLRDHLGVLDGQSVSSTPKQIKQARTHAQHQLRMALSSLPTPQNNFELVDADQDGSDADEPTLDTAPLSEEDAALRDAKLAQQQQQEVQKALARRSQAVKRNLPRPALVDLEPMLALLDSQTVKTLEDRVQALVGRETVFLLHHDANVHPLPGSKHPDLDSVQLQQVSDDSLSAARKLIHMELAEQVGFPGASPESLQKLIMAALDDDEVALRTFDDGLRAQWQATRSNKAAQRAALDEARGKLAERATLATKGEKMLSKLLGGYQARSAALGNSLKEQSAALTEAHISINVFQRLFQEEQGGKAERIDSLGREVGRLETQERTSQHRYRDLDTAKAQLQEECEILQDQIDMRHAEALNQQAL